jgi:hypothetical protein
VSDDRLREFERRWRESATVEHEQDYARELWRAGCVGEGRLELAARLGHPTALALATEQRKSFPPRASLSELKWARPEGLLGLDPGLPQRVSAACLALLECLAQDWLPELGPAREAYDRSLLGEDMQARFAELRLEGVPVERDAEACQPLVAAIHYALMPLPKGATEWIETYAGCVQIVTLEALERVFQVDVDRGGLSRRGSVLEWCRELLLSHVAAEVGAWALALKDPSGERLSRPPLSQAPEARRHAWGA